MRKKSLLLTLILSVSITQAQVGINTTEPQAALHVDGDLIVTETPLAEDNTSIEPLYVDSLGRFVKPRKEEASSQAFVINTWRDMLDLTVTTNDLSLFNNANYVTFGIDTSDVIVNNLGMSIENQVIRVGKTGLYKIDSSINFRFASSTSGSKLFIDCNG